MSGWARQEDPRVYGVFVSDMTPAGGVVAQDMPARKPAARPRKRIRGVPEVTGSHPDYIPGQGTWRPV